MVDIDLKDIWPQERDFIAKPERYKYVRQLVKTEGCVFCHSVKSEPSFENLLLYRGKKAHVIMNKYPYNNGHLLVITQDHVGDLLALDETAYNECMTLVRESVRILKKVYQCPGLNLGMNHGAVSGAGIPDHLHWHIIPRWAGDTNFFPLIATTKVLPETLEQSYKKLFPEFQQLKKN